MSYYEKSAAELSRLLDAGEATSKEIVLDYIAHIKEVNPDINAFINMVPEEEIIAQAERADAKRAKGEHTSPLAGVPVAIKDNINQKGLPTTCGSKMLENYVSPYDATVIEKIREADMVLLGKLNLDEFAVGTTGESSHFGATKNPRNRDYVAGGSSSGSVAAVGAGLTPFALGSDTGGSIRVPSSYSGVVGFKPTYGSVSRYGGVSTASSFDQIGTVARTVRDAALLYDVIKGHDDKDATSVTEKLEEGISKLGQDLKGIKIGLPKEYFDVPENGSILSSVRANLKVLENRGAQLIDVSIPSTVHALVTYFILSSAEISSNIGRFDGVRYGHRTKDYKTWEDLIIKSRSESFGYKVQKRIMFGTFVLTLERFDTYFTRAKHMQAKISSEFMEALSQCDVLATPTTYDTASLLGEDAENNLALYMDYSAAPVNLVGLPAVSVPIALSEKGLPIGIQLIGKHYDEATLLGVAEHCEQASTIDFSVIGGVR